MDEKTEYKVIKETYSYRFCSSCGGTGSKKRKVQGHLMKEVCRRCKGTCKEKLTHRTEVELVEALREAGML